MRVFTYALCPQVAVPAILPAERPATPALPPVPSESNLAVAGSSREPSRQPPGGSRKRQRSLDGGADAAAVVAPLLEQVRDCCRRVISWVMLQSRRNGCLLMFRNVAYQRFLLRVGGRMSTPCAQQRLLSPSATHLYHTSLPRPPPPPPCRRPRPPRQRQ